MKYTKITLGVKRDVRHAQYNVSQCHAELAAHIDPDDDLEAVYKEVHADAVFIVEEMAEVEKLKYNKEKYANKNK